MGRLKNGYKGVGDKAHRKKTAHKTANKQLSEARRSQASPDGAGAGAGAGNVQDENAPPTSQRRRVGLPFLFGWFGAVVLWFALWNNRAHNSLSPLCAVAAAALLTVGAGAALGGQGPMAVPGFTFTFPLRLAMSTVCHGDARS